MAETKHLGDRHDDIYGTWQQFDLAHYERTGDEFSLGTEGLPTEVVANEFTFVVVSENMNRCEPERARETRPDAPDRVGHTSVALWWNGNPLPDVSKLTADERAYIKAMIESHAKALLDGATKLVEGDDGSDS